MANARKLGFALLRSTADSASTPTAKPRIAQSWCLTGGEIVTLLRDLNHREGLTIIMVTHNMDIVAGTDRVVRLVQGRVELGADSHHYPDHVLAPAPAVSA